MKNRRIWIPFERAGKLKDEEKTTSRLCYHRQRQKRIEDQREYREKNKDKIRKYREANRIDINEYHREYRARRLKDDPTYILQLRGYSQKFMKNHQEDRYIPKQSQKASSKKYRKKKTK